MSGQKSRLGVEVKKFFISPKDLLILEGKRIATRLYNEQTRVDLGFLKGQDKIDHDEFCAIAEAKLEEYDEALKTLGYTP